ncbi:MAG: molybdopterin-dependent oxidoreductase [Spirochaetes bacterium]|nr:molybdopterin-dependent oxidoreductase [Spirochaetota bacterium]
MNPDKTITINGSRYEFQVGETVLEVARRNGIFIPTLCHLSGTTNTGACRICVVEVEGMRNLVASCAMPASKNMVVFTDSPRVTGARRFILALLMVSGNHNCAARGASGEDWTDFQVDVRRHDGSSEICDAYGSCVLQELAYRYQAHELIPGLRLPALKTVYPAEDVNPYITRDFSRCILCGRCVKACKEIQVNNAISYGYRGMHAKIVTAGDSVLAESDCVFCGECIQACPVGALVEKDVRYSTRFWGMRRVPSTCGYCSAGCAVNIYVRDNAVVRIDGAPGGANGGSLCVKGRYGFRYQQAPGRLMQPLVKKDGALKPASWEDALAATAGPLREIIKKHGPDAVAGIASARCTNEDAYAMQKFFRAVAGTNNIDNTARLVDAPAVYALRQSAGVQAIAGSIADIDESDCIMVVGSDATTSHPVIAARIKRAAAIKGVPLIVVDPRATALAGHAKYHLRPDPGTDAVWMYGFMHVIFNEKLIDEGKAGECFGNIGKLKEIAAGFSPGHVEKLTGIPAALLSSAARAYAGARSSSLFYSTGITQHMSGTANVRALADLALLCGHTGAGRAGINPLRGPGNAQGACDMGCLPDILPGYCDVGDEAARSHFGGLWGCSLPGRPGKTIMEIMEAIEGGGVRALIVMGADLISCLPDTAGMKKALEKLELLVVHDILMTETAAAAGVVFPARALAETEGTLTSTERRVQRVRQAVEQRGQSREGWRLFVDLSRTMGSDAAWNSSADVFDEIARDVPAYSGMSHATIDREGGVQWRFGGAISGAPETGGGGALLFHAEEPVLPEKGGMPFSLVVLGVIKEYFHYTGDLDSVARWFGSMNPADAGRMDIDDGDRVKVTSSQGSLTVTVALDAGVKEGTFYLPLHPSSERVNDLLAAEREPASGIPAYKSFRVKIEKLKM